MSSRRATGVSTGGKPRTLLRVNPWAGFALGVQVDAEATTSVLVDLAGKVLEQAKPPWWPSQPAGHGHRPDRRRRGGPRRPRRGGPAAGHRRRRRRPGPDRPPPRDGAHAAEPARVARRRVARPAGGAPPGLPVLVDNDATVAVMGERWVGGADAARTSRASTWAPARGDLRGRAGLPRAAAPTPARSATLARRRW